jgi:predicted PurR-regulated permease PerM
MNLNLTTATRYGLNVLALLGLSIALYLGRSIFVPLTIAVLLAAILYPSAVRLNKHYHFPWFVACLTTVLIMVFFGLAVFYGFARAVPGLIADIPKPNDEAAKTAFYDRLRAQLNKAGIEANETFPEKATESGFYQYVSKTFDGEYITNALLELGKLGGELLLQGVLIIFILLFLLLEGESLAKKVRNIFGPGPDTQRRVTTALAEMAEAIRTYLVWRTVVNIGLGFVLGAVYYAVGLKQWYLWALFTAVLCYVPYLGTIVAGVPPVLDALLNIGPGAATGILIFYIAVVTFEGYILVPWVMGRSMDLNATTVILSCLFWDYVWGTAGLFLAMPLMAGVKAVCLQVDGWRPWGNLMGSGEAVPPDDEVPLTAAESEEEDLEKTQVMDGPLADPAGGGWPLPKKSPANGTEFPTGAPSKPTDPRPGG